jgi:Na+-driven multidrug efflux pump
MGIMGTANSLGWVASFVASVMVSIFGHTDLHEAISAVRNIAPFVRLIMAIMYLIPVGFSIYWGASGNGITIKSYLKEGYRFSFPDSREAREAIEKYL